jgi:hypothetical protein
MIKMSKKRSYWAVSCLAAVALATAVMATSAFAAFESATGELTTGKAKASSITLSSGGAVSTCSNISNGVTEFYDFKDTIKEKKAQHIIVKYGFAECSATIAGVKVPATIKGCAAQIETPTKGATTGTVTVHENCVLETSVGCTVEASEANNKALKTVKWNNTKTNLELTPEIGGLTSTVNKACGELEVKANKEGKLAITGAVAEGVKST